MTSYHETTQKIIETLDKTNQEELLKHFQDDDFNSEISYELFDYIFKNDPDFSNIDIGQFMWNCVKYICEQDDINFIKKICDFGTEDDSMALVFITSAANVNNYNALKYYKDNYPEPDMMDFSCIIHILIKETKLEMIKYVFDLYSTIKLDKYELEILFDKACDTENLEIMDYLCDKFNEDNLVNKIFHKACMEEKFDIADHLYDKFKPTFKNKYLLEPCKKRKLNILKYIVEKFDKKEIEKKFKWCFYEVIEHNHYEIFKFFIENFPNRENYLFAKSFLEDKNIHPEIKSWLNSDCPKWNFDEKYFSDDFEKNFKEDVNLLKACEDGNYEVVKYIIEKYGDDIPLNILNNCFMVAIKNGHKNIYKILKEKYKKIDHVTVKKLLKDEQIHPLTKLWLDLGCPDFEYV